MMLCNPNNANFGPINSDTPATPSQPAAYRPARAVTLNQVAGDETSVVCITQPGTYILNAHLAGQPGKNGIRIEADNVTLELNGYSLLGCDDSQDGICIGHIAAHVTIRNGSVTNWGRDGVDLSNAVGCKVSDVTITGNKGFGLLLGEDATLNNCTIRRNREALMAAGDSCKA